MRRVFLMASLVFLGLSNIAQTQGIEIEAGGIFLGKTEIELIGSNTLTGKSELIEPDNTLSYTGSVGYIYGFHERFSIKLAGIYTKYKTNTIAISGASESSAYEGHIINLRLSGQFDLTNNFSFRVGTSYPLSMVVKGVIDNTTNVDEFPLEEMSLGFNAGVGYNFTKSLSLRLGYVMNIAENTTAGTDLKIKVSTAYLDFQVGYKF